jgi:hypothetical protein
LAITLGVSCLGSVDDLRSPGDVLLAAILRATQVSIFHDLVSLVTQFELSMLAPLLPQLQEVYVGHLTLHGSSSAAAGWTG